MERQEMMHEVSKRSGGKPFDVVAHFVLHAPGSYTVLTELNEAFHSSDDPNDHTLRQTAVRNKDMHVGAVNRINIPNLSLVIESGTTKGKDWATVNGQAAHKHKTATDACKG